MKKKFKRLFILLLIVSVCVPVIVGMIFPNTSKLILCLVTQTLPSTAHLSRIRNDLLAQDSFVKMLAKHEKSTVRQFKSKGAARFVKKYIHKTPVAMFDLPLFHDYWEVWVRTDIIDGRPLTSFLVRLGLIKDTNAEKFFSAQCGSDFCKSVMTTIVGIYNQMFDWGVFKPIRLNITESDQTSSIRRTRVTLKEWHAMVLRMHQKKIGVSYTHREVTRKPALTSSSSYSQK